MKKPKFEPWVTDLEKFRKATEKKVKEGADRQQLEQYLQKHWEKHCADPVWGEATKLIFEREALFESLGKPYFKVWPKLADMLSNTKIQIPTSELRPPYSAFTIMLPRGQFSINTLMVSMIQKGEAFQSIPENNPGMHVDFVGEVTLIYRLNDDKGAVTSHCLHLRKNETLATTLSRWNSSEDTLAQEIPGLKFLPDEEVGAMFRLSVAVMLFAINRHELVAPDVMQRTIIVPRDKAGKRMAQKQKEREAAKTIHWKVGSEIDLPRDIVIGRKSKDPKGGGLEFGHIRSGFMRMQPCGPQRKDRRIQFIAPTVVRKDLPQRQMHGYRIGRREEYAGSAE